MNFIHAKHRYENTNIRYPERGKALGNGTYLYKINNEQYEVWCYLHTYDYEKREYVKRRKSLYTVEPLPNGETLLTITNKEHNQQTVGHRLRKWARINAHIADGELRFKPFGFNSPYVPITSWPALTEGLQFVITNHGYTVLKSDQKLRTSERFVNREKAKPIRERYNKFVKFGKLLTTMDALTYKDVFSNSSNLSKAFDVMEGKAEPTLEAVCAVVWQSFWWKEKNNQSTDVVKNQSQRFLTEVGSLKRKFYKAAGLYESKEYK